MKKKIKKYIARILLLFFRYDVLGKLPELKKYIIITAPHKKYKEVPLGWAVGEIQNAPMYKFFMKHEITRWPIIGKLMISIGMIPVIRTDAYAKKIGIPKSDYITTAIDYFGSTPEMILAVAPEGTTRWEKWDSPKWQRGFYAIAIGAGVPVIMIAFDHDNKKIMISGPLYMSGNILEDREKISEWYSVVPGYKPVIPTTW